MNIQIENILVESGEALCGMQPPYLEVRATDGCFYTILYSNAPTHPCDETEVDEEIRELFRALLLSLAFRHKKSMEVLKEQAREVKTAW